MAQKGFAFQKGGSWFLKYRDNFNINGQIVRKLKCVKLAEVGERYRSLSDLDDLISERMGSVRQSAKCPQSSELFIGYVEGTWLPFVQRTRKASTYAGYRSYWMRYIRPRVEKFALRDFSVSIVSNLLDDVAGMHSVNVDTVGKIRSILSAVFTFAMGKGHFPGKSAADNPASRALIPEAATQPDETVAATREEVTAILKRLADQGLMMERAAVALIAYTGVRPGECRGLRWEEWNRTAAQIKVARSVWHAIEGTTKTEQSNRFVTVHPELRTILLDLWKSQGSPMGGYILGRAKGRCANLDNMSKRSIMPALTRCAVCKDSESAEHKDHAFERDTTLPTWPTWYALRRFHGTDVRMNSDSSETTAKALGNSKAIADKHYIKPQNVLPDVRRAVNQAFTGLVQ